MTLAGAIGRVEPPSEHREALEALLDGMRRTPEDLLVPVSSSHPASCFDGRPWEVPTLSLDGWCAPERRVRDLTPKDSAPMSQSSPALDPGRAAAATTIAASPAMPAPRTPLTPRVAGGTLSTWIVDLLLTALFLPTAPEDPHPRREIDRMTLLTPARLGEELQSWTPAWLSLTCAALRGAGLPVSAHTDDRAAGADCGCGAADSLGSILALLGQHPRGVDDLLGQWGVDPGDLPTDVVRRCAAVALNLPTGDGIVGIISGHAQSPMPVMHGPHGEVAVLANTRPGTTVDVPHLTELLAGALPADHTPQAFIVDTWSFGAIADFFLDREDPPPVTRAEVIATVAAFNAATLLTLCGPGMPTVALGD